MITFERYKEKKKRREIKSADEDCEVEGRVGIHSKATGFDH